MAHGNESERPFPLVGLRVLDLSRVLSGPFAGRILTDLGAEVVKVEPPDGDLIQMYGAIRGGCSGFYVQQNAGKRNVCVDLRSPGGPGLVRDLAARADVVIENFAPGVADRLGIGWPALSEGNPGLVMLSISGYGVDDPPPARRAFAACIHAATGLVLRQADRDGQDLVDPMLSIADILAGLHGAVAVLAALRLRDVTGRGQWIDLAMLDAMLASDEYAHHYLDGSTIARLGGVVWLAADGPVMVAADTRHTWLRLATTTGLIDGLGPEADLATKIARRQQILQEWMAARSREEVEAALETAGVLCCDVISPEEALHGPDAARRGVITTVDAGDGGRRQVVNMPYRFSSARAGVRGGPSRRGQDNAEVLEEWLGITAQEYARLFDGGVIQAATVEGASHGVQVKGVQVKKGEG